jgi:hypothetical protein
MGKIFPIVNVNPNPKIQIIIWVATNKVDDMDSLNAFPINIDIFRAGLPSIYSKVPQYDSMRMLPPIPYKDENKYVDTIAPINTKGMNWSVPANAPNAEEVTPPTKASPWKIKGITHKTGKIAQNIISTG